MFSIIQNLLYDVDSSAYIQFFTGDHYVYPNKSILLFLIHNYLSW